MIQIFPDKERFGLVTQLMRPAVSVSSNIAEGSGRNSDKDFAHFLELSYGSLMEIASQVYLAIDQQYVPIGDAEKVLKEIDILASKIVALNRALRVSDSKVRF